MKSDPHKWLDRSRLETLSLAELHQEAVQLAERLFTLSQEMETHKEARLREKIAEMIDDPRGKNFATYLADLCFRSSSSARTADEIVYLIDWMGLPDFLTGMDRASLKLFRRWGRRWHNRLVPIATHALRKEMRYVILPGESAELAKHIQMRQEQGVRVNLNHLGEAVLGEEEAERRLATYIEDLKRPEVDYISVKVSSICSRLNPLSWEETLERLRARLRTLYRAAIEHKHCDEQGNEREKFVNLDMEEYRDLFLTIDLFRSVLDEEEFLQHRAGMALQAYLPDTFPLFQELTKWAIQRVDRGGAPIKIRIVKGANLAMEQAHAALMGWPQTPYEHKWQTDANFKRMLEWALRPEHARAVHIGVGSHNLFDLSFALLLRASQGLENEVSFEMLEGMADGIRRAVHHTAGDMLLYCPAAEEDHFHVAIAYLIRRLDEQTAPKNFLHDSFSLQIDGSGWNHQKQRFLDSAKRIPQVATDPRRTQNRFEPPNKPQKHAPFRNEPDTDWTLPHHREYAHEVLKEAQRIGSPDIPLVIAGKEIFRREEVAYGIDPSRPQEPAYRYCNATAEDVECALQCAKEAENEWGSTAIFERCRLIAEVAQQMRIHRKELMAAMLIDGGKLLPEADKEISEAIDFAEYYRRSLKELASSSSVQWHSKGTILVTPPWNFPCAIPAGGVVAALLGGNCVLFKPAPEALLVGWVLAQLFWKAGISRKVLQFLVCEDEPLGSRLIRDSRINSVILTGGTETARKFMKMRPGLDLHAETGGKNSLIISDLADLDLAVRDLVYSAFGHGGQKCSAASLAICLPEVYQSETFRFQLRDAAASLIPGSAWNLGTELNPLIRPPEGALLKGLTTLDEGEEWLLQPEPDPDNPHLWTPGIKLGVKPGSFMHLTELFGPLLGVMEARDLQHACELANAVPYGLTSGLHSLDPREQQQWQRDIVAGNLYINRTVTGAIVRRQPFGGTKWSSFGIGMKAGGPNYIAGFMEPEERGLPERRLTPPHQLHALEQWVAHLDLSPQEFELFEASLGSYAYWWNELSRPNDASKILGEDNLFYHIPHSHTLLRVQQDDNPLDIARICAAAVTCGAKLEVSWDSQNSPILPESWPLGIEAQEESESECCERIISNELRRIRTASSPSTLLVQASAEAGAYLGRAPVLANGRIELLHYLREVAVSHDYHRYGNLGLRDAESRAPLALPNNY